MIRVFTSKTQVLGEKGEEAAVTYLKRNGYRILERNCANRFGEIDIVAMKKGNTYFFEVKAGREEGFINPAENFTKAKLGKFFRSIEYYCLVHQTKFYRAFGIIVLFGTGVRVEIIELF